MALSLSGDVYDLFEKKISLKEGLDSETYDLVRKCLGLKPLLQASVEGKAITDKIRKNLNK